MAVKMIDQNYNAVLDSYEREWLVDTEADVATLPECCAGSTALVVETGVVYVVNASGEWVVLGNG